MSVHYKRMDQPIKAVKTATGRTEFRHNNSLPVPVATCRVLRKRRGRMTVVR